MKNCINFQLEFNLSMGKKNCINSITECGAAKIPQGRIVGGNTTFEGEHPWMVAIFLHGNNSLRLLLCKKMATIHGCSPSKVVLPPTI